MPERAGAARLCILILQYNSTDLTLQLLESLVEHEGDALPGYRVLVMDNGSDEPGASTIQQRFPFVEFRAHGANLGFAAAHNLAMRDVAEPWVLLLNNDCLLLNPAVELTYRAALAAGADFATCQLRNADMSPQINFSTAPTPLRRILLNFSGINRLLIEPFRLRRRRCRVGYVNGAFLLLRRASIPAPELFDARYFMYTEDLDLMIRLHRQRCIGLRVSDGQVVHLGGASAARHWGDASRLEQKERQALDCMRRYYPRWQVAIWGRLARLRRRLRGA